jgi:hypothetical protein
MAKISMRDLARVVDFLDELNDPRRTEYGNIRHKFENMDGVADYSDNLDLFDMGVFIEVKGTIFMPNQTS